MNTSATRRLPCWALALLICLAPSLLEAQGSGTRGTAPTPILTVIRPSQGQVVDGDLEIAVAAQQGSITRRYSVETAYWDNAKRVWVYPGLLSSDFGGTAPARVAADRRVRLGGAATRWRIRVHSVDPPGSWGQWREFLWQGTAGQAGSSGAAVASAPGGGVMAPAATAAHPAAQPPDVAALVAQLDKNIAALKKQIVLLNLKIAQEKLKIDSLQADMDRTDAALHAVEKQPMTPDSLTWFNTVVKLMQHIKDDQDAIVTAYKSIGNYKKDIKEVEAQIFELEGERAALLAKS